MGGDLDKRGLMGWICGGGLLLMPCRGILRVKEWIRYVHLGFHLVLLVRSDEVLTQRKLACASRTVLHCEPHFRL